MTTRFVLARKGFSPSYLSFGAEVVEEAHGYAIVEVAAEHAEFVLGRLMSGLEAGAPKVFETLEAARAAAERLARRGV